MANSILQFIIQTAAELYISIVVFRFLLQLMRADFYSPISQLVIKATNPLLIPIRKFMPNLGRIDFACFCLALILQIALLYLLYALIGKIGAVTNITAFIALTKISLIKLIVYGLNIFLFSMMILAIASWVMPQSYNPALILLHQLIEPLSSKVRKVIPPLGGIDFAFMILVFIIYFIKNQLEQFLM